MLLHPSCRDTVWPLWKKILFRFFFIYLVLFILPFNILAESTGLGFIGDAYNAVMDPMVKFFNDHFFHVAQELVPIGGSGDTSYGWAQFWMFIVLAAAGCLVWSLMDRRRMNYEKADYWICIGVRYYLGFTAFLYGILKIFAMQMPFPSLTQMATPLGDYLPMRFSWLFIGYSAPYQIFSGIMETIVGILLLWRRTATLGTVMALAVFFNVMMLNLCYDIPVKLFSMNIVMLCLFLLAHEWHRIHAFFIVNREAAQCNIYDVSFPKKWMRISRVLLKCIFVILAVGGTIYETYGWMKERDQPRQVTVLRPGVYDVDYLPGSDSIAADKKWRDLIIEPGSWLTVRSTLPDTSFREQYARTWMNFKVDSLQQVLLLKPAPGKDPLYRLQYEIKDSTGFLLRGRLRGDSVLMMFTLSKHRYQLGEKQFHWLSEKNR